MSEVREDQVTAALDEWMGQAAAFMFNTYFGVENEGEPWNERKERLRPWMRAALEAALVTSGGVREENARLRTALMMARGYVDLSDRNVTGLTPTWREVVATIDAALAPNPGASP